MFLDAAGALQALPTGIADTIGSGIDLATTGVSKTVSLITDNWMLWLAFAMGILGFSISIFRRLRKHK